MELIIKCADISNVLTPHLWCFVYIYIIYIDIYTYIYIYIYRERERERERVGDVPDTRGKCPTNTRDVLDTPRRVLDTPGRVLDTLGDVLGTLGHVPKQLIIKCADISNVHPTPQMMEIIWQTETLNPEP